MSKYSNSKIYKLTSSQTDKVYIGSTTQTLTKRLSKHKSNFKRWKNGKYSYTSSYELIKYDDVYIELLELCPCSNKMELCRREGKMILDNNCVNKHVAGRTKKESATIYRHKNKEKIKERKKEYVEANKEKIKEYKKEYDEANKERLKERRKEYVEANKEKIKEMMNEKFTCECGGKYTYANKSQHFKSKKHLKFVNQV